MLVVRALQAGAFADFVGGAFDYFVAGGEGACYFDEVAIGCAFGDVDPLGSAVAVADHEGSLARGDHGGARDEESGVGAADGPLDGGVHAGGQGAVGVVDVELDGHGAGLGVEDVGDAGDDSGVGAVGLGGHLEVDTRAGDDAADGFFGNGGDQAQAGELLENEQGRIRAGADECAGVDEAVGDGAVEGRGDAEVGFEVFLGSQEGLGGAAGLLAGTDQGLRGFDLLFGLDDFVASDGARGFGGFL